MNGVSLFSGAGGFEVGLERAGISTVLQAEQDKWCLEVLARHWPDVERVTDVRLVNKDSQYTKQSGWKVPRGVHAVLGSEQPSASNHIDIVYGGFPCQDVSVAGNRAGLDGARSGLWSEFCRVLSELRPTWFLFENVPGLLSNADGRDFGRILSDVDELGYGVAWAVLDARHFGVPQRRRRVFAVGCLGNPHAAAAVLAICESCGGHSASSSEAGERTAYAVRAGIARSGEPERGDQDLVVIRALQARDYKGVGNQYVAENKLVVAGTLGSHHGNVRADQAWTGQLLPTLAPGAHPEGLTGREAENGLLMVASAQRASDGHHGHSSPRGDGADNIIAFSNRGNATTGAETLRAGSHGAIPMASEGAGVRRLTPLECERLMGWPDDHTRWTSDGREIPDSHRYRMCGNGVVASCAEWIGRRIVRANQLLEVAA